MHFQFIVFEKDGRRRNGKVSAQDIDHARSLLLERGLEILSVEAIEESAKLVVKSTKSSPSKRREGRGFKPSLSTS